MDLRLLYNLGFRSYASRTSVGLGSVGFVANHDDLLDAVIGDHPLHKGQ